MRSGGAVILCARLVDALVEVQTLGRVDGAGRTPRRPTRIDATLARPFAMAMMAEVMSRLGGPSFPAIDAVRHLAGASQLRREMEVPVLRETTVGISLSSGAREATIRLLLPDVAAQRAIAAPKAAPAAPKRSASPEETLREAQVGLQAVLPTVTVPLSRLTALRVGDTIPLPDDALSTIMLRGGRLDSGCPLPGRRDAAIPARLGQQGGRRAVKINDPDAPTRLPEGPPPAASAPATSVDVLPASLPATSSALSGDLDAGDLTALADLPGLPDLDDLPAL